MAENEEVKVPTKHWLTTLILCWFLGFLGIHRLYVGRIASGLLVAYWTAVSVLVTFLNVYLGLACFVGVGSLVVFDFVLIATKKFKDCYGRTVAENFIK